MMDKEKFDKVFTEEVTRLGNHRLLSETDIDRTVEALTTAIYKAIDLSTPWARPSIQAKPWWTPECQRSVQETRILRNRFTRAQTEETWREYLDAKNRKGKTINRAKTKHFRNNMRDAGETQDRIWRVVRWAKNRANGKATQVIILTLI